MWTGSCPCQPFSVAGKGKGTDDERHLWPALFRLIRECRPSIVFGEQVTSKAGREWFAGVRADLEGVGYGAAAADLCAAGVGAPHIRQRLYWVAQDVGFADRAGWDARKPAAKTAGHRQSVVAGGGGCVMADAASRGHMDPVNNAISTKGVGAFQFERNSGRSNMADAEGQREPSGSDECSINSGGRFIVDGTEPWSDGVYDGEPVCDMANADSELRDGCRHIGPRGRDEHPDSRGSSDVADADDAGREGRQLLPECADELAPWSRGVEWRRGADGKERRVKSGVRLLVNGVSGGVALERSLQDGEKETHIYSRVGALRGFGNAIVPQLAAEFIKAFMSYGE